jgi:hypothetical protein
MVNWPCKPPSQRWTTEYATVTDGTWGAGDGEVLAGAVARFADDARDGAGERVTRCAAVGRRGLGLPGWLTAALAVARGGMVAVQVTIPQSAASARG